MSQFITGRPQEPPTFIDRLRDQAAYWGWSIGTRYGEPFWNREPIGVWRLETLFRRSFDNLWVGLPDCHHRQTRTSAPRIETLFSSAPPFSRRPRVCCGTSAAAFGERSRPNEMQSAKTPCSSAPLPACRRRRRSRVTSRTTEFSRGIAAKNRGENVFLFAVFLYSLQHFCMVSIGNDPSANGNVIPRIWRSQRNVGTVFEHAAGFGKITVGIIDVFENVIGINHADRCSFDRPAASPESDEIRRAADSPVRWGQHRCR